jgi:oligopeptide transport system substrate-binding protein
VLFAGLWPPRGFWGGWMRRPNTRLLALSGALAACGLTSGEPCGDELCFGPMTRAVKGQILVYNNGAEPQHIDPGLATGTPDGRIIDELFEGLLDYHPKTLAPVPGVADRYEVSPDNRHFLFHLRPNALWSNGDKVTAFDFAYSWERVLNPLTAAQYSNILFPIKNAEDYNSERVRLVTAQVTGINDAPTPPAFFEEGAVVRLIDSNAARITSESVSLSSDAGAAASGAALPKDQIVLVRSRKLVESKGEKVTWFEVDSYPGLDLEDAEQVKKAQSASAVHGWIKESEVAPFFPSSNRRVLARPETLKIAPDGGDVLLLQSTEKASLAAGDEVKIIALEGDFARVYWPQKERYGYLKRASLLDPWANLYRFKVAKQGDPFAGAAKQDEAPAAQPVPSSPSTAPSSAPSSAPVAPPVPAAPVSLEGQTEGWVDAGVLLLEPRVLGFRAIDASTFEVYTTGPTPYFLSLLAHYTYRPIHRASFEKHGIKWTEPANIVGNGPFRLVERKERDVIVMEKSDNYWEKEVVTLEKIIAYSMDNLDTTLKYYKSGQTDLVVANDLPPIYVPVLEDKADFQMSASLGTYFYRINVERPPLNDVRVRKALAMGIDRAKVSKVAKIPYLAADSITPPGIPGADYEPPNGPQFNPEEARKLLAEAGYPDGKGFPTISILYNTNDQHKKIAEFVQAQWKKNLKVDVVLDNREWKTYLQDTHSINFQLARAGWIGDYLDPMTFLDMWITDGGNNNTHWGKPEYDQLVKDAQNQGDKAKRIEIMKKMETMLNEEMPFLPIYTYVWFGLTKPYVIGYYQNMQDKHPLKWVCIETSMVGETSSPVCKEAEARIANLK